MSKVKAIDLNKIIGIGLASFILFSAFVYLGFIS